MGIFMIKRLNPNKRILFASILLLSAFLLSAGCTQSGGDGRRHGGSEQGLQVGAASQRNFFLFVHFAPAPCDGPVDVSRLSHISSV